MPEKIGHYTIVSQLGRGGMGVVYKAHEESLNRFVAIKVLTEGLTEDQTFLQRFVREAQAAAGLSHPNIVQIYFIGEDDGKPFFVMEYVTGRSLNHILREEGRVGNPRASQMILQAAHGLAAAHDKGIIHRDIKPANLILDDRGMIKIADFGLALPVDAENRLTATGMMVGTPGYLAPEQCRGEKVDHRTDIYALGITYYQLLTGTAPFKGESPLALLKQILDEEPPDVATINPEVDAESRRILQKMIHKDRNQRYQDCHQIVADLEEYIASKGVRSMTAGLATVRVPTANIDAGSAPTQAVTPAALKASQDLPTTIVGAKPAAVAAADLPTTVVSNKPEPATSPDIPMNGPPTQPPMAAPAYVPPQPQPAVAAAYAAPPAQKSSSKTLLVVGLALLLVIGGVAAAGIIGMKMFGGWKGSQQLAMLTSKSSDSTTTTPAPAVTSSAATTSSSEPAPGVLLSQQAAVPQTPTTDTITTPAGTPAGTVALTPTRGPQGTVGPVSGGTAATSATSVTYGGTTVHNNAAGTSVTRAGAESVHVAPVRKGSGVVFAVTGDQNLVGAINGVVASELSNAVDAATLPATEDLVRDGSSGRLISRLRDAGYATLVLVRAEPAGQRELKYMGRYDTAYSSRVTITTYDLATSKPFGNTGRGTIEYTSANADRKAEEVVGRLAREAAEAIQGH